MRNFHHRECVTVTNGKLDLFTEACSPIAAGYRQWNRSQRHLGKTIGVPQQTITNYQTAQLRVLARPGR